MPNWVYNTLTIEGEPTLIKEVKDRLNKPFTRFHDNWNIETGQMDNVEYIYDNPVFAFWNVIRPTDLETYQLQKDPNHDDSVIDFKGNNWYDWNVRNWGTKWDVAVSNDEKYPDTELHTDEANGENWVLVYSFNTAWSPAFPIIKTLSSQLPSALLTLSYEEETGWGGEAEFANGELLSDESYGWKCRECDHTEDETPYCETCEFDMCPKCGYGEPMEQDRANCEEHKEGNK